MKNRVSGVAFLAWVNHSGSMLQLPACATLVHQETPLKRSCTPRPRRYPAPRELDPIAQHFVWGGMVAQMARPSPCWRFSWHPLRLPRRVEEGLSGGLCANVGGEPGPGRDIHYTRSPHILHLLTVGAHRHFIFCVRAYYSMPFFKDDARLSADEVMFTMLH